MFQQFFYLKFSKMRFADIYLVIVWDTQKFLRLDFHSQVIAALLFYLPKFPQYIFLTNFVSLPIL